VATGGPEHYQAAIETLLSEDGVDMVLVFFVTAPFVDLDAIAAKIKEACGTSTKPVVTVIETSSEWYGLMDNLRAGGIPVYEFSEDGVRALAAMSRYAELRDRKKQKPPTLKVNKAKAEKILAPYQGKGKYLPQFESFELLKAYGIPVPRVAAVNDAKDLTKAAKVTGFPCVLKVDSSKVIHKSDQGGVILDITNRNALGKAFAEMDKRFGKKQATYLLMEQKQSGQELILGAAASPGLGSLVLFGLGGIFVEVMKDVATAVAPLSRPEARELMKEIKGYELLKGVRGKKGVDLKALEDLLLRVSRLAADFPEITEMDLNPVFAYPRGKAPAAVDVRVKVG
jgi:acetyltransferase